MKIAIIGSPGSGKSYLGSALHTLLQIPLYHLDKYQWKPGWEKRDPISIETSHNDLCDADEWIIEGCTVRHFSYRAQKADVIIFLDIPRSVCLYRIFKRAFTNFGKVYYSSAPGCKERFPSFSFLKYVWQFPVQQKVAIEQVLDAQRNEKLVFILKTTADVKSFLSLYHTPAITSKLVAELLADQFPQWSHKTLEFIPSGWDNRTFRLGADLLVRLPSGPAYAAQVAKEQRWLPFLASKISYTIPRPVALGKASTVFPYAWSVYQWIEGEPADRVQLDDEQLMALAQQLAAFLTQLHLVTTAGGPTPGRHNFYRGGDLSLYAEETISAIEKLKDIVDADRLKAIWLKALGSRWRKPPVWVHGDLSRGNLLLQNGQLAAIIDFGCMAIGDPACDLMPAWTLFNGKSRALFQEHLSLDEDTWLRARGWALWKALITLISYRDMSLDRARQQVQIIEELCS